MLRGFAFASALLVGTLASPAAAQVNATSPAAEGETASILVFSRTEGWRHDSIDAAWSAIADIAHEKGWSVTFTEDGGWLEEDRIGQFDAVVFALASGNSMTADQQASFRAFVENGGGFVGLHSAGDSSLEWDWYTSELIGARFIGHPLNPGVRTGTVRIEDAGHPATGGLPETWYRADEWYSFDTSVRGRFHVLATLDESSYVQGSWNDGTPLAMGGDHPIAWNRCVGEGRSFYNAMGHTAESYAEEGMRTLIAGGIDWALGEGDCPPEN